MAQNSYYEIYLHVVWHTKNNTGILRGHIERTTHEYLRRRIVDTEGVFLDATGGTDDHVHLAVHIAPTTDIAGWIGDLKGACSHYVNNEVAKQKLLYWQTGYGVVSFGRKNLPFVCDYIRNQREHHARGGVIDRLERVMPE
jgi:putative transposase